MNAQPEPCILIRRDEIEAAVDRLVAEIRTDYQGFTIPDKFLVGYGLD